MLPLQTNQTFEAQQISSPTRTPSQSLPQRRQEVMKDSAFFFFYSRRSFFFCITVCLCRSKQFSVSFREMTSRRRMRTVSFLMTRARAGLPANSLLFLSVRSQTCRVGQKRRPPGLRRTSHVHVRRFARLPSLPSRPVLVILESFVGQNKA